MKKERLKTAKYRKISSTRWLQRHINDVHVAKANKLGYRSRSAIKLLDIEKKFHLISKANCILDIGSAPGGWLQVETQISKQTQKQTQKQKSKKLIIGLDLKEIKPIDDATLIQGDFCTKETIQQILNITKEKNTTIDLITSDMAPATCGDKEADHLRIMNLVDSTIEFAKEYLSKNGSLIVKIFMGRKENETKLKLKKMFNEVHIFKPEGSYKDSSEIFFVCISKL